MSDEATKCGDLLQEEIGIAEAILARLRQHLASPELTPVAQWKALLEEATTTLRAGSERAQQAGERVKSWMEEVDKGTPAPLDESDLDGEVIRIESKADKEQRLALDAMVVAAHAILQAECAVLEASHSQKVAIDLGRFRNVF